MKKAGLISLLPYQQAAFDSAFRMLWLLYRRQAGKSHLFAAKAISRMIKRRNHSIFVVNASLLMGQENILKEAQVWGLVLDHFRQQMEKTTQKLDIHETSFKTVEHRDKTVDLVETKTRKVDTMDPAALAAIFENSKMEARVWHSRTVYSRTRIVAPNPLTARGFTGDIFGDECAFWQEFDLVMDAIGPIIARNPEFIMWMATTPSPDESHPTFDLLMPRDDAFTPNARGNWYETAEGIAIHRCDAHDTTLAGLQMFGKKGQAVTVAEARAEERNKKSFDRNYLLKFVSGGSNAIARHLLIGAQTTEAAPCGVAIDLGELSAAA